MLMIYLFLLMILMKSTYYKTPSKNIKFSNFTHELNINNKLSFLDVLINSKNNNTFITFADKNILIINPLPSTLKVNASSVIKKKAVINALISRAKLIPSSKKNFPKLNRINFDTSGNVQNVSNY